MIDTVVLGLSSNQFTIVVPEKFTPSARWINNPREALPGIQSKQNPTKTELKKGIYKPRLLLSHRINEQGKHDIGLKIELSLPKLLFGNNFNELQYKDFNAITNKLVETLASMGIITTSEAIANAPLSTIHYAKNFLLTDGSIPYSYLQKIKQANIKLTLDVNQTDYRNEGHCYKWHSNSYEIVFYDKIKDLEQAKQSDKRAIEKDSILQLRLCDTFATRHMLEILRMEVRLNKRKKMRQLFGELGIKSDLTFKSLYKRAIAKKVLHYYLDELERKRLPLLDFKSHNDKAFLANLIVYNANLSANRIMQMFGLKKALELVNIRELRVMLKRCNDRNWYRLIADAKKLTLPDLESPFAIMRKQLIDFKPLKLAYRGK